MQWRGIGRWPDERMQGADCSLAVAQLELGQRTQLIEFKLRGAAPRQAGGIERLICLLPALEVRETPTLCGEHPEIDVCFSNLRRRDDGLACFTVHENSLLDSPEDGS